MNISSVNSAVVPLTDTVAEPARPQAKDRDKLVQAVKAVNDSNVLGDNRELTFVLDRATHRTLTRIIDRQTHEVVMQIPAEYVLQLAQQLKQNSSAE